MSAVFLGLWLVLSPPNQDGNAASSAGIRGVVRSSDDRTVHNITLILFSTPEHPRSFTIDPAFAIEDLPPGRYTVVVVAPYFAPWSRTDIRLASGQRVRLSVELKPSKPAMVEYPEATAADLKQWEASLAKMNELPLCDPLVLDDAPEAYRFVWMRTFEHPIVVRLRFPDDGNVVAMFKESGGAAGYEIGDLISDERRDVKAVMAAQGDAAEFIERILKRFREEAAQGFWELPYAVDDGSIVLDGASWIVEGVRNSRCHVVYRWSPRQGTPLREFAERILRFTGKRFYYDEFY